MNFDYVSVTELSGDNVSREQIERICHRYLWAGQYCRGKDVIEVACGTGQGLGYISQMAHSLRAGDYSEKLLAIARAHYRDRVDLYLFDAQRMPFEDESADVIIIFEAVYYLPRADEFVKECGRVLRKEGKVLLVTANKDLYDFSPSPHSHRYFGVGELKELFEPNGFDTTFFGNSSYENAPVRQRLLRGLKMFATKAGLIPRTMQGKKLLKRLVFGKLLTMPAEIREGMVPYSAPTPLSDTSADLKHKVIYCEATLQYK